MIDLLFDAIRSLLWLALALSISLSVSFTLSQLARLGGSGDTQRRSTNPIADGHCPQQ